MNTKYSDLINQTFYFPQEEFTLNKDKLPEHIIPANNYPMLYVLKDIDGDGDIDFYNVNSLFKILFINDGKGNLKNGL